MSSFQIVGLSPAPFEPLYALSAEELAARGIRRVRAGARPGFPCRVSLADADPGDELLLLPFEHQPANSPYRASGPIYVKVGARQRTLAAGEVPESVRLRQISLRAYDAAHMIVDAEVCDGESVAGQIERLLADSGRSLPPSPQRQARLLLLRGPTRRVKLGQDRPFGALGPSTATKKPGRCAPRRNPRDECHAGTRSRRARCRLAASPTRAGCPDPRTRGGPAARQARYAAGLRSSPCRAVDPTILRSWPC